MQCICPDIAKALALTMAIVVALSKPLTVENLEKMNIDASRYKVSITQVDTFTRRYCKLDHIHLSSVNQSTACFE